MPAFKGQLSDQQIADVAQFVYQAHARRLDPPPAPDDFPRDAPSSRATSTGR